MEVASFTYDRRLIHNLPVCEECCRILVIPKHPWQEHLQEHLYALSEITIIAGKHLAAFLLGIEFIVEAIFPHLNRQKTPDELKKEREQIEWEEKREREVIEDEKNRAVADINEESDYINSLKVSYVHTRDGNNDKAFIDASNKLIAECNAGSCDQRDARITLRKYAVDVEQLRLHEVRLNRRRDDLLSEIDYHVSEESNWINRANASTDSREKSRCKREAEHHQKKVYEAQKALQNI